VYSLYSLAGKLFPGHISRTLQTCGFKKATFSLKTVFYKPVATAWAPSGAGDLLALKIEEICVNWALFPLKNP